MKTSSKKVFNNGKNCYFCGKRASETHHIYGGYNRDMSTKYGCLVSLCHDCHTIVHFNKDKTYMQTLRKECEKWCLENYGWTIDDFIKHFSRNYL